MKSDALHLAGLFYETGMINHDTFREVAQSAPQSDSKSLVDVLKQDVSLKTMRDLFSWTGDALTTEIPIPRLTAKGERKDGSLQEVLSQPFYLTKDDMKTILKHWEPHLDTMLQALEKVGALPGGAEQTREHLGEGEHTYDRLVENNILETRMVNRASGAMGVSYKKANRLILALNVLKFNDIINEEDAAAILEQFQEKGQDAIPQLNREILPFIQSEPQMPEIDMIRADWSEDLVKRFPEQFIRQNLFVAYRQVDRPSPRLEVVMPDPFYVELTDTLSFLVGMPVVGYFAPESAIIARINQYFPPPVPEVKPAGVSANPGRVQPVENQPEQIADSHSAVELVSRIIDQGVASRATDIHLEPSEKGLRVRYRIDGRLRTVLQIPPAQVLSVNSRIKVLSKLDVTERRRPQDGHFALRIGNGAYDFRVSTLPTNHGEKTVVRVLDESRVMLSVEELGVPSAQAQQINKWIYRPHGLVLVTGPTGSGKTSTLYACLNTVNDEAKNIVTIEDPVEYSLEGVNQVQVESHYDLGFADGLRSILRQDPDIIMVGEIRDPETARIAMRAALTGHLVFSTLHTNTAAGAIATLQNMGIEPYMLSSAITGVINQRLVRKLCTECKKQVTPKKSYLKQLGLSPNSRKKMWEAVGCESCLQTGYLGRIGVFELMPMNNALAKAILEGQNETELVTIIQETGEDNLLQNAVKAIYEGNTSAEEILETLAVEEG